MNQYEIAEYMSIFLRKRFFFLLYCIVVGFDTVTEISEKSCNFFYDYYMMGKRFSILSIGLFTKRVVIFNI